MKDKLQRTDWFTWDVLPIRNGIYEREIGSIVKYAAFFNGNWKLSSTNFSRAASRLNDEYATRSDGTFRWRGLTEPAE